MKYRDHSGDSIWESMEKVEEFPDRKSFEERIARTHQGYFFQVFDPKLLTLKPYGYDDRIKWDTYLVSYDGKAIGYTDGPCPP